VAAAVQREPLLEGREGAVQGQVAAGQGLDLRLKGREGVLEGRIVCYGTTSFWLT